MIDHPSNPPSTWHNSRNLWMVNPVIAALGPVTIHAGSPLTLRYRVVVHDGPTPTAVVEKLAAEFRRRSNRSARGLSAQRQVRVCQRRRARHRRGHRGSAGTEGAEVIVADSDAEVLRQNGKMARDVAADLATAEGVEKATDYALEHLAARRTSLSTTWVSATRRPSRRSPMNIGRGRFEVNLMGTVRTCRALVPKMAARGGGAVVNTGSDLAKQPEPGFMDYGA